MTKVKDLVRRGLRVQMVTTESEVVISHVGHCGDFAATNNNAASGSSAVQHTGCVGS